MEPSIVESLVLIVLRDGVADNDHLAHLGRENVI
jgi:hypothetical protein